MRRHHDSVHTRPQRSRRLVIHRGNHLHADDPLLLLRTLDGFDIIKKLPLRLTPKREAVKRYRSNRAMTVATSNKSLASTLIRKSTSIKHLLSMKPGVNPQRLTPGFVFVAENMQPRKSVSPVYRSGWGLSGLTLTLNERTPPIPQLVTEVA